MSKFMSLSVACALVAGTSVSSFALPSAPVAAPPATSQRPITTVREGCGPAFHLSAAGVCVPNRGGVVGRPGIVVAPGVAIVAPGVRACPPGFHLGAAGRVCRPN